ncbi:ZPR1-related zinc finger protein [Geoglobus ahangari]|uniref:ZPR1-related zinc finger protein n=1 Tax=Geoglobus ahangari TaxID=113653 RepID=A0A0F7IDF0_9EURY|nr:ZPR1 zinc finger domain-containing protein [Geoglobus ahangari]AKG91439.1 ZPR1-related zinc finger protein [Geoglobus ahangari]
MIPCPVCGEELNVVTATYDTPYFGKLLITSISCRCGFKHSDSFVAEIKDPVRFTIEVNKKTLFSKVVRSTSGTIRIPELGLAMEPGPASQGFITNVEGVLMRFEDVVEMAKRWNSDDADAVERCNFILEKLRLARDGKERLTIVLEDPHGNSMIISDEAFMEKMSEVEARSLKTGLTVVEITGEDYLKRVVDSASGGEETDVT